MNYQDLIYGTYSIADIKAAVAQPSWQIFREGLKGVKLSDRLDALRDWVKTHNYSLQARIQVTNYINALKRGGMLK